MTTRALLLTLALAAPAGAQTVSPGLELANPEMTEPARREVRQRVEEFLARAGQRDAAAVRAMLAPRMVVAVIRQQPDGTFTNRFLSREEFVAEVEKNARQSGFREQLANVIVTIDGGRLAYLRADFTIVRDGKVQSSGVDQFTLVREGDGWKIAALAYTSLPR